MMAAVGQRDTPPELAVPSILRTLGVRYRVNNRDLPGSPDIANRKRSWAVFVHGCFWHGHEGCPKTKSRPGKFRVPNSNSDFWRRKIEDNRARDARSVAQLGDRGFHVEVVWECELRDLEAIRARLHGSIGPLTIAPGHA